MSNSNTVWKFFSSVKLALFTLFAISITSIIGTIIPQNRHFEYYAEQYGEGMARFFYVLDIPEMYSSWWFLTLLGLLCANLIVCSIDRFPLAWKQIKADPAETTVSKIESMGFNHSIDDLPLSTLSTASALLDSLSNWKTSSHSTSETDVIAAHNGGWSRTGVYIVHLSILVIFAGAIVGHFLGFKGSVVIPETKQTDKVYASESQLPIPLGFEVRCDFFEIEFYDNGMPKEYRSRLTVTENGKETLVKEIEVNDPLKYRGITFYQSSYEGYRDFIISLTDSSDGSKHTFIAPFQQQVSWDEKGIVMGIINAEAVRDRVTRLKVWIKSGDNPPNTFWLDNREESTLEQSGTPYTVNAKQMYATGLQVAKDPGVWLVYLGCFMMMAGLYIAFFMSHKRIWLVVYKGNDSCSLRIAGSTNKNKLGFEKVFTELVQSIENRVK